MQGSLFDTGAPVTAAARAPRPLATAHATLKVSSLREQSLCAFRGFSMARLGLEPLRTPLQGFDPMERGMLLHDVLELVWQRFGSSEGLALLADSERDGIIARAIDRALARRLERRSIDPAWARRERTRLRRLLDRWLEVERSRPAFAIDEIERAHRLEVAGLEFSLRIDRVDRLPDGRRILVDYKTGVVKRDWDKDRPKSPQLALYARAVEAPLAAAAYAEVSARNCAFLAVADDISVLGPHAKRAAFESEGPLSEEIALWQSRVDRLARELRAGRAEVDPLPSACPRCHLQPFCRIDAPDGEDAPNDGGAA